MIEREPNEFEEPDSDAEGDGDEEEVYDLDDPSDVFLSMRSQNVELLKIAVQIAGYDRGPGPLKPNEVKHAVDNIWKIYSEIYEWVDPEEIDEDDDEEE